MHGSSCCLGCCTKPKLNASKDNTLKEPGYRGGQSAWKPSLSDDFGTTSMDDVDISALLPPGSSTENWVLDSEVGAGDANAPSEFVNHGLLLWNQSRQHWIGNKRSENRAQQVQEPKLNLNAIYDNLLGSNKPFPQPIPLSKMVDFLVKIWQEEDE